MSIVRRQRPSRLAPGADRNIKLTQPMTGSQVGCTTTVFARAGCSTASTADLSGRGLGGRDLDQHATVVANLTPLYNSRVFLEIDFSGGVPVATSSRAGLGYVTK